MRALSKYTYTVKYYGIRKVQVYSVQRSLLHIGGKCYICTNIF